MTRKKPPEPQKASAPPKGVSLSGLRALFSSIGGEKGLEEILIDFYSRMADDALVGFFFDRRDTRAIAMKQKEFLLRAMGAAKTHSGRTPARAHEKLPPILTGHFDRRLRLLEQTLRDHGLGEPEIRTWVAFENAFRSAIVKRD
ncbi:MAG: group 1 truncated hemoglobin [Deltaproteobacteria bacterium]|nr:group 1 truncated hemoglobin [Deltaproteobacteria bacterium]